ncbi:MAG TPA: hypothetical protein VFJ98_01995, partial [Mycobacteriales bacterium]|nr:hypothetical protein [Mycobacteriales bacterium]
DDSHYLALAKAFVDGKGYVDTSIPGSPVESLYPPGYPLLLTPLVWLFGGAVWPLRALSALAFVGCFPLLDRLLRRHGIRPVVRVAALAMFALSPTAATFATEVMPESVFLLVLLAVLLALPRWEAQSRLFTWSGGVVALGAPYLLLLKAAGLPMLVGVAGWLLLRRRWRQLATTVVTSVLMLLPLVVVRLSAGPVVGTRYTNEYALAGPLWRAAWSGLHRYVTDAIPATLVPTQGADLMGHSVVLDVVLAVIRYTAAALVVVGFVAWLRRRLDVTSLIVPLYLAETAPFPFINQRRIVLLLPLVVAWYVIGWERVVAAARRWLLARRREPGWRRRLAVVPAVMVLPLLAWQLPRDYLLRLGESTPAARGSGYIAALHEMTPPGWSIATGYQWTIADLTGRTASNAAHFTTNCPPGGTADLARLHDIYVRQHVATVLDAWLKWPKNMDNSCMLATMSAAPWAVPVYHGSDASTVFVLIGPGTARADEQVLLREATPTQRHVSLPPGARVSELSVVLGDGEGGRVELRTPDGRWVPVDAQGTVPPPTLLHARLAAPVRATALRYVGDPGVTLRDLVVLGTTR